jgi:hypothetical protein
MIVVEHARMWVKYNMRGPVLAADDCWRRLVCSLIDHEWRKIPWRKNLRCRGPCHDQRGQVMWEFVN